MLTVDVEEIMMGYPSMWELMQDLKDMGEGNAIFGRCGSSCFSRRPRTPADLLIGPHGSKPFIKRDTLIAASSIYTGSHAAVYFLFARSRAYAAFDLCCFPRSASRRPRPA